MALLSWHYPAGSTALAFQQQQLAAMLRLAEVAGVPAGRRAAAAQQGDRGLGAGRVQEECRELGRQAAAVLQLHFGSAAPVGTW